MEGLQIIRWSLNRQLITFDKSMTVLQSFLSIKSTVMNLLAYNSFQVSFLKWVSV